MTFYNLRTNPPGDLPYQIIKFDADLNPESVYNLGSTICECPAGHQPRCRHRTMLAKLIERVDTAWFWCFETATWEDPTGNAAEHDEVAEHDEATGGLEANPIERPVIEGTEVDGNQEAQPQPILIAGEGPGPSTLAATLSPSPSQDPGGESANPGISLGGRGQPAAKSWRRF